MDRAIAREIKQKFNIKNQQNGSVFNFKNKFV